MIDYFQKEGSLLFWQLVQFISVFGYFGMKHLMYQYIELPRTLSMGTDLDFTLANSSVLSFADRELLWKKVLMSKIQ